MSKSYCCGCYWFVFLNVQNQLHQFFFNNQRLFLECSVFGIIFSNNSTYFIPVFVAILCRSVTVPLSAAQEHDESFLHFEAMVSAMHR